MQKKPVGDGESGGEKQGVGREGPQRKTRYGGTVKMRNWGGSVEVNKMRTKEMRLEMRV